jgi:hypothetical protein
MTTPKRQTSRSNTWVSRPYELSYALSGWRRRQAGESSLELVRRGLNLCVVGKRPIGRQRIDDIWQDGRDPLAHLVRWQT